MKTDLRKKEKNNFETDFFTFKNNADFNPIPTKVLWSQFSPKGGGGGNLPPPPPPPPT